MNGVNPKSGETAARQADRIVTIAPDIIEVSEVLNRERGVESDTLVDRFVFNSADDSYVGQRKDSHHATTLAGTILTQQNKAVIVRARSIQDAEVIYKRNKGIAY